MRSTWPNSVGKKAQAKIQPPGKASKKLTPQEAVGLGRGSMLEMEPEERETPGSAAKALSSLGAAPRMAAEPSVWEAEAPPAHMFLWLTKCDTLCLHFSGGKRGRGQMNSEALGRV